MSNLFAVTLLGKPTIMINWNSVPSNDMILNFLALTDSGLEMLNREGKPILCDEKGGIIRGSVTGGDQQRPFTVESVDLQQSKSNHVQITLTIDWTAPTTLLLLKCSPNTPSALKVESGVISLKNTWGELDTSRIGSLAITALLLVFDLIFGVIWMALILQHWKRLLVVQKWATFLFILNVLSHLADAASLFFENISGIRNDFLAIISFIFSAETATFWREVLLLVAAGKALNLASQKSDLHSESTENTKTRTMPKIIIFGVVYFFTNLFYSLSSHFRGESFYSPQTEPILFAMGELMKSFQRTPELFRIPDSFSAPFIILINLLPIVLLDTVLFIWVLSNFSKTMGNLSKEGQTLKLSFYKRFFTILVTTCIIAVIFAVFQFLCKPLTKDVLLFDWICSFAFQFFWGMGFSVVLAISMLLWRPTSRNTLFASSMQLPQQDYDDFHELDLGTNEEELDMISADNIEEFVVQKEEKAESTNEQADHVLPVAPSDAVVTVVDEEEEMREMLEKESRSIKNELEMEENEDEEHNEEKREELRKKIQKELENRQ